MTILYVVNLKNYLIVLPAEGHFQAPPVVNSCVRTCVIIKLIAFLGLVIP